MCIADYVSDTGHMAESHKIHISKNAVHIYVVIDVCVVIHVYNMVFCTT